MPLIIWTNPWIWGRGIVYNVSGNRKCVNCMRNSHIFVLKTFFLYFKNLVLTFQNTGGNINKLSLMRQTKFENIRVESGILSYRHR